MIAAGKEEIRQWFIEGVEKDAKYMLIVYDRMDFPDNSDSPYYAESADSAQGILRDFNNDPMCEVMEIYDLSADMEAQLAEKRTWRLPKAAKRAKTYFSASERLSSGKTRRDFVEAKNKVIIEKYFEGYTDVSVYDSALYANDDRELIDTNGVCLFTSRGTFIKTGAAVYRFDEDGGAKVNYIRLYDFEDNIYDMTLCHAETKIFEFDDTDDGKLYIEFELRYNVKYVYQPEEEDKELRIVKTFSRKHGANRFRSETSGMDFFRRENGEPGV